MKKWEIVRDVRQLFGAVSAMSKRLDVLERDVSVLLPDKPSASGDWQPYFVKDTEEGWGVFRTVDGTPHSGPSLSRHGMDGTCDYLNSEWHRATSTEATNG